MKNSEHGRSMVEMLGVLAIIAVLSVAGLAGFGKALDKYKTNKAKDQFREIANNIMYVFYNQHDYSALGEGEPGNCDASLDNAIRFGVIPEEMIVKSNGGQVQGVKHAFGGDVCVSAYSYGGKLDSFVVAFSGLPRKVAMELSMDGNNENVDSMMRVILENSGM